MGGHQDVTTNSEPVERQVGEGKIGRRYLAAIVIAEGGRGEEKIGLELTTYKARTPRRRRIRRGRRVEKLPRKGGSGGKSAGFL